MAETTPKEKLKTTKLVREFSAGGVVVKKNSQGQTRCLLIRPKGTERWQLPKGRFKKGETSRQTAQREVEEEGGVEVKVIKKLGNQQFFYFWEGQKRLKTVTFYLMEYLTKKKEGYDKNEVEEVIFLPFALARQKLTYKNDKEMLTKASLV